LSPPSLAHCLRAACAAGFCCGFQGLCTHFPCTTFPCTIAAD
jgi:hypothetical protein